MKKISFLVVILMLCMVPLSVLRAQENISEEQSDKNGAKDAKPNDKEKDPKGLEFTYIPLPSYSSDDGFGFGLRVYATHYAKGFAPYDYQLYGQLYRTTEGYEYHIISLDKLKFLGSPFRVKAKAGFERYLNAQYYGYGNYHDMDRQKKIVNGEIAVNENLPESPDLIQINDEITINENFIKYPGSINSLNPGRRILRERQNKFFNYDRIRPFAEASSEDFFGNTNFKWFVGFRLQSFKIQTYWHDKEGGEAEENTKTLIDIEKPTGYEATEDSKIINSLRFALAYDSRPRMREKNPNEGILTDIHVETTGKGTGSDYSYTRVTTAFRQYIELFPSFFRRNDREMVFTYRLLGQQMYGDAPFFDAGFITPMSDNEMNEGLGTNRGLRGYSAAQFIDNTMAMLNTELRFTVLRSDLLGGMDFVLLGYYDMGRVAPEIKEMTLKGLHRAYGGGLRLIWKRNTVINISYGRSKYGYNMNFSFDHPF